MKCPICGYETDAQNCPLCGAAMNAAQNANAASAFSIAASFWDSAANTEPQCSSVPEEAPAPAPNLTAPQQSSAPEHPAPEAPAQNTVPPESNASEIPIPASFFKDDAEKPQTVFSFPAENAGSSSFTIRADSLEYEAVGKQETSPAAIQKNTSAPRPAKAAPPVQQPERGFYAVPEYDGSLRAALSRIRHKWLVPALVAGIFAFGMTAGILLAKSSKPEIAPEAGTAGQIPVREMANAAVSEDEEFTDLMNEALMLSYVQDRLLPRYGYAAIGKAVSYDKANGILSVLYDPEKMTVFRCENGALCIENYIPKNARMNRAESFTYPDFLNEVYQGADALPITADESGISLGSRQIWEQEIAVESGTVTVCTCAKQGDADSTEAAQYIFSDETGIREEVNGAAESSGSTEGAADWHALYAEKLRSEAGKAESTEFALLYIDDDDTPELVIRGTDAPFRLFTVRGNAVTALLTGSGAETIGCTPFANRYYETGAADDGGISDYFYWCHIENGAVVRDYRRWIPAGSVVAEYDISDSFKFNGPDAENTDGTEEAGFYALTEEIIHNLLD